MGPYVMLLIIISPMHQIEPYLRWLSLYDTSKDERSPFYGKEYNFDYYSETIYGYYIDPFWDFMGSETLYVKILFADYVNGYVVIEFIGEWNDAINNDIMNLKRNVIDHLSLQGVNKYLLIGESVFNFHGSDDSYYEEWFEDVEDGWVAALNFREHVIEEFQQYNVDSYVNFGGQLQFDKWRTLPPLKLCEWVDQVIVRRLGL